MLVVSGVGVFSGFSGVWFRLVCGVLVGVGMVDFV